MKHRIIIAGPTASGKSSLAVLLAESLRGEIISVDSRQCYKRIDIGTAKPTEDELRRVPHHNISLLEPDEEDSVRVFKSRVMTFAAEVEQRGRQVIFCGGSTLHLQSVFHPLDDLPPSNPENIRLLGKQAGEQGLERLYDKLLDIDPVYARKMDGLNRQRIFRALDVWMQTGKPFSSFHQNSPFEEPSGITTVALNRPRPILHERISARTRHMIDKGLVEETRGILDSGYNPDIQALQTVGYRQVIEYLAGKISREQMIADINTQTRRYARRQIIWLRRWPFVRWLDMEEYSEQEAAEVIKQQVAADKEKG